MKPTAKYVSRPISDEPRDTESWALTEAARRLIDASRSPNNQDGLSAALILNQKLWTIFQIAISEDDCQLPKDLRENLAALSLLVDRETTARLIDGDGAKLDTLVQINRAVASGLAQRGQTVAAAKAGAAVAAAGNGKPAPMPAKAPVAAPAGKAGTAAPAGKPTPAARPAAAAAADSGKPATPPPGRLRISI